MRVIITGGTGLIGRALTSRLAAANHEVIILSRSPGRVRQLPVKVQVVGWDAKTAAGWAELADGAGAIVNLAGENIGGERFLPDRWTKAKRQRIRESRQNAGRAVVEAVRQAATPPGMVLQASAIGYYGVHGDEMLDENSPPGDDFLAEVSQEWEQSTAGVMQYGVRWVAARIGLLLSKQSGALPRVLVRYRLLGGGPFGNGRQWWSWVHLDDVAAALHFLVENAEVAGPVNVTSPNPVTNNEFGKTLARIIKRPHYFPLPAFLLRLALGEVATVVVDGQRVLPHQLQAHEYPFHFPQLEAALRDLVK
jgi:uncharacterized protein (TIGR01777 family)